MGHDCDRGRCLLGDGVVVMTHYPIKPERVITNPVEAHLEVSKAYSEQHEELMRLYRELDWYRGGLEYIAEMPNSSGGVARLCLQKRPYK